MIVIVGAGLAGLTAGKILSEKGISYTLYEADARIGGRVKSDFVDGYILDHGFQVLLDSYPQAQAHLKMNELELGKFAPGAKILLDSGVLSTIADPLRSPQNVFGTLLAPVGSLVDKVKILQLMGNKKITEQTTLSYLKEIGFSDQMINNFFRPFFSGVFLENELRTDASYFHYLYKKFSEGLATLPKKGMGEIINQLANMNNGEILCHKRINSIDSGKKLTLHLSDEQIEVDHLIMATDGYHTSQLLPELEIPAKKRSVTTLYFSSDKKFDDIYLYLNASGKGRVNHLCQLSAVQPAYAPAGKSLFSVTLLDIEEANPGDIKKEINNWDILDTQDWIFLKSYKINYALPETFYSGTLKHPDQRIYLAGDFTETSSIEGAMKSGEKAAYSLLEKI